MITLDPQLEKELQAIASETNMSIPELIKKFMSSYQDEQDIKDAEQALKESDSISLSDLKKKYAL